MQYSYLIIDSNKKDVQETLDRFDAFPEFFCAGIAENNEDAVNKILEMQPQLVFLEISQQNKKDKISLALVSDLYRYIDQMPYFVALATSPEFAFEAIQAGISDYLLKPLNQFDLRKSLLKFQKSNTNKLNRIINAYQASTIINADQANGITNTDQATAITTADQINNIINTDQENSIICIRSYGDYQFISLNDIMYLKADNNTTDFFLQNGRKLTAYKTLKHYEANLPLYFFRVHNSYIVNINFISRINTGKSLCYLNNSDLSIPFSKTFKDNIDIIIKKIAPEYL